MERVRICVVGTGRAGTLHARNFLYQIPRAELVALVDSVPSQLHKAMRELKGEVQGFVSLTEALGSVAFDAVLIATSTITHADLVEEAASQKKHVFCEKPLAVTLEECRKIIGAVKSAGIKFQIGFMRRYDPAFQEARRKIEEGLLGEIILIKSTGRGPGLPPEWAWDIRKSNGILAEVNSHDFDSIRWLSGSEFKRVYAEAGNFRTPDVRRKYPDFYDHAVVTLRMENGAMGVVDSSCPVGYGYDARVEILGAKGMMQIGELKNKGVSICTQEEGLVSSVYRGWPERFAEAYLAEDRAFVDGILEDHLPSPDAYDGLRAVEVVLAANRSIETGRVQEVNRIL
ncbi:MAG: Gfo/Idh/MocA family oxidoreductase [Deltaproteobacteria bacterium]|nr:Gfo/Idh/MocA family oxidoreductase [Deltaproteobacteria bacterium]